MLPDTGERYMSTPLFDEIEVDMTADELELSQSTPSGQFDAVNPSTDDDSDIVEIAPLRDLDRVAVDFYEDAVASEPVVMFALEWCEFSWSVRKLFQAMAIDYRSVDLDSVDYQTGDFGGKIREVLHERLGTPTIPQVFVAGQHIGGATESLESARSGRMQSLLAEAGIPFDEPADLDPYDLLPKWVQPRKSA